MPAGRRQIFQIANPLMHSGESNRFRIKIGIRIVQCFANFAAIGPFKIPILTSVNAHAHG